MTLGQITTLPDTTLQLNSYLGIESLIVSLSKQFINLRNLFMLPTENGGGVQIEIHTAFIDNLIALFDAIENFLNSGSLQQIKSPVLAAFTAPKSELINFLQSLSNSVNIQKGRGKDEGSDLHQLSQKCDVAIDKFSSLLDRFFERQRES